MAKDIKNTLSLDSTNLPPVEPPNPTVSAFFRNAWFFILFFLLLLMIASFGLIAEA